MPTPEISKESSRLESGDGNMSGHGFLLEQQKQTKNKKILKAMHS